MRYRSTVATVALVLAACGGDAETEDRTATGSGSTAAQASTSVPLSTAPPTTAERTIEVTVVGGLPEGGARRERVRLGETVVVRVTSDKAEEVHLHGYDLRADVAPGAPAVLRFEASVPGVFEVELEGAHRKILELEIAP